MPAGSARDYNSKSGGGGSDGKASSSSTFRFLITTDNHLGYLERDPRRGEDSYTTFEEVLRVGYGLYSTPTLSAHKDGGDGEEEAQRSHPDRPTSSSSSSSSSLSPFPCVDAMLHSGDLFHDNKPSLGCLVRVCSLFRKYVFGSKPIEFELLSDPRVNFPTHALPLANFQDPNLNISLPVFAINGNHDDPVGGTSALDILATNGCLNYFGLTPSLEAIHITPILLKKGSTYIALYGLGHIRDERLLRCFRLKKVTFEPPPPLTTSQSSSTRESREGTHPSSSSVSRAGGELTWFRLLLLHQNRSARSSTAVALGMDGLEVFSGPIPTGPSSPSSSGSGGPPTAPPAPPPPSSFRSQLEPLLHGYEMDLVLWGHEHLQQMKPQTSPYGFDVVQPGSTIRTALPSFYQPNPEKQCGILEIRGSMYRLVPIPLKSVRPLVMRTVELAEEFPHARTVDAVEKVLREVLNEMIIEAEQQQVVHIPEDVLRFHPHIKFPLVALAVDFNDASSAPFPKPNVYRLGQEYMDVVANPQEMIRPLAPAATRRGGATGVGWSLFGGGAAGEEGVGAGWLLHDRRRRRGPNGEWVESPHAPQGAEEEDGLAPSIPLLQLHDIRAKVAEVFDRNAKDACTLLSEMEMTSAVHAFAEKGETAAIDERIVELLSGAQKYAFRELKSSRRRGVLPAASLASTTRAPHPTATTGKETVVGAGGPLSVSMQEVPTPAIVDGEGVEGEEDIQRLLNPDLIAAAVARRKRVLNQRYHESLEHELRVAANRRYHQEGTLEDDDEGGASAVTEEEANANRNDASGKEIQKKAISHREEEETPLLHPNRHRDFGGSGAHKREEKAWMEEAYREGERGKRPAEKSRRTAVPDVFDVEDGQDVFQEDAEEENGRGREGGRGNHRTHHNLTTRHRALDLEVDPFGQGETSLSSSSWGQNETKKHGEEEDEVGRLAAGEKRKRVPGASASSGFAMEAFFRGAPHNRVEDPLYDDPYASSSPSARSVRKETMNGEEDDDDEEEWTRLKNQAIVAGVHRGIPVLPRGGGGRARGRDNAMRRKAEANSDKEEGGDGGDDTYGEDALEKVCATRRRGGGGRRMPPSEGGGKKRKGKKEEAEDAFGQGWMLKGDFAPLPLQIPGAKRGQGGGGG